MDQGDSVSRAETAREKLRGAVPTEAGRVIPTSGRTQHGTNVQRRWKRLMDIIDR